MYTAEQFHDSVGKVKDFAAEADRELSDDFAFTSFIYVSMHEDVETARNNAIEQMTFRFNLPAEKIVDRYCAYGPDQRIIENLESYVKAGANKLIVALIMPPEERMDYVERFATNILPELQKMKAG